MASPVHSIFNLFLSLPCTVSVVPETGLYSDQKGANTSVELVPGQCSDSLSFGPLKSDRDNSAYFDKVKESWKCT